MHGKTERQSFVFQLVAPPWLGIYVGASTDSENSAVIGKGVVKGLETLALKVTKLEFQMGAVERNRVETLTSKIGD